MAKYEVIRPWRGVKMGDVLELNELHPALKPNVRLMKGEAGFLHVASPNATSSATDQRSNPSGRSREPDPKAEGRRGSSN